MGKQSLWTCAIVLLTACGAGTKCDETAASAAPTAPEPQQVEAPSTPPSKPAVSEPPPEPKRAASEAEGASAAGAEGEACLRADDCQSGVCEGEGCSEDAPGVCVPALRRCTKDLRPYCGCNGETFRGSGTCPGARYAHRGPCGKP